MTSLPGRVGAVDVMTSRDGDASEFEAELGPLLARRFASRRACC